MAVGSPRLDDPIEHHRACRWIHERHRIDVVSPDKVGHRYGRRRKIERNQVPQSSILPRSHLHDCREFGHEPRGKLRLRHVDPDRLEQGVKGDDRAIEDLIHVEVDAGRKPVADRWSRRVGSRL